MVGVVAVVICLLFIQRSAGRAAPSISIASRRDTNGRVSTSPAIFRRTHSSSRAGRAAASGSMDTARRSCGTRWIRPGWIAPSRQPRAQARAVLVVRTMGRAHLPAALCWKRDRDGSTGRPRLKLPGKSESIGRTIAGSISAGTALPRITHAEHRTGHGLEHEPRS